VPHLNELQKKMTPKGLTIVALTRSVTDKFMQDHKITYPVGVGGSTAGAYGVSGIPQVYLIAGDGKVVWEGHTSGLSDQMIEDELAKLVAFPKRDEWPRKVSPAASAAEGGKLGDAWKKLERLRDLEGDDAEAAETLRAYIAKKSEAMLRSANELADDQDYYGATRELEAAKRMLKGHPSYDEVSERLKAFKKDRDIQKAVKAGALLEQGQALEAKKDYRRAFAAYAQAARVGEGTKAGDAARKRAEAIAGKAQ
jgi:tetratricopeptide (TPR) repeat protein